MAPFRWRVRETISPGFQFSSVRTYAPLLLRFTTALCRGEGPSQCTATKAGDSYRSARERYTKRGRNQFLDEFKARLRESARTHRSAYPEGPLFRASSEVLHFDSGILRRSPFSALCLESHLRVKTTRQINTRRRNTVGLVLRLIVEGRIRAVRLSRATARVPGTVYFSNAKAAAAGETGTP
jgi:hypothetical protein